AGDDVAAVIEHFLGVETTLVASDALHQNRRLLVDKNAHDFLPAPFVARPPPSEPSRSQQAHPAFLQAATALSAASLSVDALMIAMPLSSMILRPASTLVPASRTTSGTVILVSRTASTTPCATQSQRLMPAKMLTSTAFTLASDSTSRKAVATRSAEAPPPTSRKFAGLPPACLIMSMV